MRVLHGDQRGSGPTVAAGPDGSATIAVTDRVGNVLGVFRMNNATQLIRVNSGKGIPAGNGLEQLQLPEETVRRLTYDNPKAFIGGADR